MRTIRVAAPAVTLGLLVITGALAQTEDRPSTMPSTSSTTTTRTTDSGSTISGKVTNVNVSGRSFTVESPTGAMTFQTNTSTHIMTAMSGSQAGTGSSGTMGTGMSGSTTTGTMGTLSNLKVGDQVRVAYSGPTTGTPTATHIEVLTPGTKLSTYDTTGTTGTVTGTLGTGAPGTPTTGSTYGTTGTTGTAPTGTMGSSTYGTTGTTTTTITTVTPVTGKVVVIDTTANTITVETSTGRETFRANASSRFLSSGRSITLLDLHEGDTVSLSFTGTGPDRMITRGEVTQGSYAARGTTTTTTPPSTYGSTTTTTDEDSDLPSTASPIPAFLAAGLILLTSGLVLRRRRRA